MLVGRFFPQQRRTAAADVSVAAFQPQFTLSRHANWLDAQYVTHRLRPLIDKLCSHLQRNGTFLRIIPDFPWQYELPEQVGEYVDLLPRM